MANDLLPLGPADLHMPLRDRFLRVAERCSERIAIIDADGPVSYSELAQGALSMASSIAAATDEGAPVALLLPVTRLMPYGMLGALLAGRPYVPLDPSFPADHLRRVLSHSGAQVVICNPEQSGAVLEDIPADVKVLRPRLDGGVDETYPALPETAAYVLYTSGSTGVPKGVWQDQRGLLHDVMQFTHAISLTQQDRLSLLYSPAVNGAIRDIFGALLNGATLCMSDLRRDGIQTVLNDLERRKVTILHAMPPVLRALMRSTETTICPSARILYTAGDRLLSHDLSELRAHLPPDCSVYTGIGSTECATLYRQWIIPAGWKTDNASVPVGLAIPDREMRLLDESGQDVPVGDVGLIEVTSPYVARGYWNDPALTETAFGAVPDRPGWRRFRPGDLGRLRSDGLLEFMGRADRQIKIRGYRLDPVEIEAALRSLPDITEAVVLAEEVEGRVRVSGFVATGSERWTENNVRDELARQLPAHLVPGRIVILSDLPRLANFKYDIAALRRMEPSAATTPRGTSISGDYLAVWAEVLKRPVAADDRFDRLGVDSLALMEIEIKVAQRFGKSLRGLFAPDATPMDLWHRATEISGATHSNTKAQDTLRRLSILMSRSSGRAIDPESSMRAFNEGGDRLPLIWCFNNHEEAEALANALGRDQPLFAFRSLNGIVPPYPPDAWRERLVAENALQSLDALGPLGSVIVGGNCQAARIALNLANGLWASGAHVASLIFMERALAVPYSGRHLVLFGAQSLTHNPRFHFARPQAAWQRYAPLGRRLEIPGAHGQFFQPNHVGELARTLRQEIDLASRDIKGPLGPVGRRVSLAAEWIPSGAVPTHLQVRITNPGPLAWAEGAISGLALTVHILGPDEQARPLRLPDLTVPLPFPILPGESRNIPIPLQEGVSHIPRITLGLCEEGYDWFTEVTEDQTQGGRD